MKISVRGWGRDMGTTTIANYSLLTTEYNDDEIAYRDKPVLYRYLGGITVAWFQSLKLTGNYRMEVELTKDDVMRLFKRLFGSEIQLGLVEKYGLTFSPEVAKSILKTVKLTDLTVGDLVEMNSAAPADKPATAEKLVEHSNVKPFIRRI